jgi:hypothetical protein
MVSVDGVDRGTTPAVLAGVAAGPHTISVRLEGYDGRQLQVTVGPTGTTSVSVNLTPSAPFMNRGSPGFILALAGILLGIVVLVIMGIYFFRKR